jgi:hypothetical protein
VSDRPAQPGPERPETEIEVTPEMIDAGINILWGFPLDCPTEAEMKRAVKEVFLAMYSTRKPVRGLD